MRFSDLAASAVVLCGHNLQMCTSRGWTGGQHTQAWNNRSGIGYLWNFECSLVGETRPW